MIKDSAYSTKFQLAENPHRYGSNFHLLNDPYHFALLNRFSTEDVVQPEANQLVRKLYEFLMRQAMNFVLQRETQVVSTRMKKIQKEAEFETLGFKSETRMVFVDLMRAGILPNQICYEVAHDLLIAQNLRQDHILLNRTTNEKGEVTGVHISGHKIGGTIDDSIVVIPDPMGATGGSMVGVIDLLKKNAQKKSPVKKFLALHLIVTPEYLKALKPLANEVEIFAMRLDRGLSSPEILKSTPGEFWDKERGLNDHDYIVPGAGGIGEVLNNSFV